MNNNDFKGYNGGNNYNGDNNNSNNYNSGKNDSDYDGNSYEKTNNYSGSNNYNNTDNYNGVNNYNQNNANRIKLNHVRKKAYRNGLVTGALIGISVILVLLLGSNVILKRLSARIDNIDNAKSNIDDINTVTNKIKTIEKYLNNYYMEDIDEETLVNGIYYGMADSLGDPYTTYYTPEEYEDLTVSSNGEYCGIGVVVRQDTDSEEIVVARVYSDSPAAEEGIEVGDIFRSVDDTVIEDMTTEELAGLVVGEKGTTVDISVERDGELLSFTLTRRKVQMDTVSYELKEGNIGYIKIEEFDDVTPKQVKKGIKELQSQGMSKGIIIDLRDNPGGGLGSVREIASMFIEGKKLFLYSETKDGDQTKYYTTGDCLLEDLPMTILINGNSASASEAFSGAMKCYERATLVGTTSFGKGIMQTIYPFPDGSALKITIGKYYLPDGSNIHKTGIDPDVEIELSDNKDEDAQLDKAIDLLK